jgi:putative flippase GtrA
MTSETIKKYFRFVQANRPAYFNFNKQLVLGEIAGFLAGVGVAEAVAFTKDELAISVSSGAADYIGSTLGFLAVYYHDNKSQYRDLDRKARFKKIMKSALSLWPSVAAADIAVIFARPYAHYLLLLSGLEAGIAATIAHFIAVGVFNGIAVLSRSIIDYAQSKKEQ